MAFIILAVLAWFLFQQVVSVVSITRAERMRNYCEEQARLALAQLDLDSYYGWVYSAEEYQQEVERLS